jgi:ribosomal protein S18 acetylase RimI-like enzyme
MASALKRDREKEIEYEREKFIDLSSLYKLYMKPDVLNKYEDRYRQLAHVDKNANKLRGYIYFANTKVGDKGDLVAFVSVKLQSGKTWVDCVEVDPKYRGNKLSHQLLDVACKEFGATDIKVNKNNEKAIKIFKDYGFQQYDAKDNYIYMSNEDIQTENPVLKKDDDAKESSYAERYVDAYLYMTADDLACESIFGKKSKEELINTAITKIKKKCDTPEKKAIFKHVITNNEKVFKQTVKYIENLDKKYEKGTISLKEYKKEYKSSLNLIHKTMIEFNINTNNFIDNKDKPTKEEYQEFLDIIARIKKAI